MVREERERERDRGKSESKRVGGVGNRFNTPLLNKSLPRASLNTNIHQLLGYKPYITVRKTIISNFTQKEMERDYVR